MSVFFAMVNRAIYHLKTARIYPAFFQAFFLAVFVALIVDLAAAAALEETLHTSMLVLWHIWWPLIPFLILFTGRLWCSVCPFSTTAIILNRLLPFRFLNPERLVRNRRVLALAVFVLIIALDSIFSISADPRYTLTFFLSLYGMLIVLALVFDYQTYCTTVCPFNFFSRLYRRFVFVRLERSGEACGVCRRQGRISGRPAEGPRSNAPAAADFQSEWRGKVECLKRCPSHSVRLQPVNPFSSPATAVEPAASEALAPALLILLFSTYVFFKSQYFTHILLRVQTVVALRFEVLIFIATLTVLITAVLFYLAVAKVFARWMNIERRVVLRGFYCLVPMLILFHLALALKDVRGIVALKHDYFFIQALEPFVPTKGLLQPLSYGLVAIGFVLSAASLFRFTVSPRVRTAGWSSLFLFVCGGIFGLNSLLTLTAIKYLQYFG